MNSKPKATTAGTREARRALAGRRRQIVFLVVSWLRLISRVAEWFVWSLTQTEFRERIYKAVWSFLPPLLSCIPLLSDRQTHLVDQNNSSITRRTKASQNPVFCISLLVFSKAILKWLQRESGNVWNGIVHSIHWILFFYFS